MILKSKLSQLCLFIGATLGFISQIDLTQLAVLPIPPEIAKWITLVVSGSAFLVSGYTYIKGHAIVAISKEAVQAERKNDTEAL